MFSEISEQTEKHGKHFFDSIFFFLNVHIEMNVFMYIFICIF